MNFFYNFIPNRIMFSVFDINIYWYGFFVFVGLIFAFITFYKIAKKEKIAEKNIYDIFFYCFLFGFFGARIGYFFYDINYYVKNPVEILKFWDGGMSIIFGIIFALITLYLLCKKRNIKMFNVLNILTIPMIIAQIIGRIGNYFNQELFGVPTSFIFKIPIESALRPEKYKDYAFFTPLFLYEMFFNLILLLILLFLLKKKHKNNLETGVISKEIKLKDFRKNMNSLVFIENGGMFLIYVNYYFVLRFVLEFFRIGEPKILLFTLNQVLAIIIMLFFNIYWITKHEKKN